MAVASWQNIGQISSCENNVISFVVWRACSFWIESVRSFSASSRRAAQNPATPPCGWAAVAVVKKTSNLLRNHRACTPRSQSSSTCPRSPSENSPISMLEPLAGPVLRAVRAKLHERAPSRCRPFESGSSFHVASSPWPTPWGPRSVPSLPLCFITCVGGCLIQLNKRGGSLGSVCGGSRRGPPGHDA